MNHNEQQLARQFRGQISQVSLASRSAEPKLDDLDLSAMAKAGLNYLRGNPDPKLNYECKFSLGPLGIPSWVPLVPSNEYARDPVSLGDTDSRMDWQYLHMREMAGESTPDSVELGVRARVVSYQHADGLCYVNPAAAVGKAIDGEWAMSWTTAKLLYSLSEAFQRTKDPGLAERCRRTFAGLKGMALWDGPRAYYCGLAPYKDGQWLREGWCESHARNYPFIVEACVRYYECLGEQEALDFAAAVTEGFLAGSQKDQGDIQIDPKTGSFRNHVHCHTHATWGVAHLGVLLKERRYTDWVRKAYDFVVSQGTDYGWYPEFIPQDHYRTEICVVGDMVSNAVWLARAGWPHYWDHVERAVRNELRRSQFFLTPRFLDLFLGLHKDKPKDVVEKALAELRKLEGGFVAQSGFDDWVSYFDSMGQPGMYANGIHMMGCCPPEGLRGFWEVWNGIVEARPEGVFVNMAIHRDHPAAKVTAYRPAEGRLDVQARQEGSYYVRPPAWVDRASVRLARNGQSQDIRWTEAGSAYVLCGNLHSGDRLTLTWGVPSFKQTFAPASIPDRHDDIGVQWTGNEVTGVEPRGKYLPMFGVQDDPLRGWLAGR